MLDSGNARELPSCAVTTVSAPARLHLGFLDLNGNLGRRFGSLGLAIDTFRTRVALSSDDGCLEGLSQANLEVQTQSQQRAEKCLDQLVTYFSLTPHRWRVSVQESIPAHSGMGSGTQMSLAVGTALSKSANLETNSRGLATILDRGGRSGVGIGAFDLGGFLIDCGRTEDGGPPPVLSRIEFPSEWRILLILEKEAQGLHGSAEAGGFSRLPAFPQERAAHLCHIALLRVAPALMERDLDSFGKGIGEIQRTVGDYFAPAQGGRFISPAVARVLAWAQSLGLEGVGQSSWGPTGFVVLPDARTAEEVSARAARRFSDEQSLYFQTVAACNHGRRVLEAQPEALLQASS